MDWKTGKSKEIIREFLLSREKVSRQNVLSHLTENEIIESNARIFLSNDGKNGFMLSVENDIQNLFSLNHDGKQTVKKAILEGGKTLDCFAGFLDKFYESFGFKITSREKNWTEGQPDVVFMSLD